MLTMTATTRKALATDAFIEQLISTVEQARDSEGKRITSEECSIVTYEVLEWLLKHPDLTAQIQECLDDLRFKVR